MIRPAPYQLLVLGMLGVTSIWGFIGYWGRMFDNFDAIVASGPFVFMVIWQFIGAALIQPYYLYLIVQNNLQLRDPTVPENEAIATFATAIAALLYPFLLFAPAWLQASSWSHHGYIALFHASPLLLAVFFVICSRFLGSATGRFLTALFSSRVGERNEPKHPEKSWLVASYVLTGTVAGAVHLLTVLTALKTRNPDATFGRLFIPTWERLAMASSLPISWIDRGRNSTIADTLAPPAKMDKPTDILEQFNLFSQFDWLVVTMSTVIFVHLLPSMVRGHPSCDFLGDDMCVHK
ncbi:hypothetical protein K432DRAFT_404791 [Lepidopterella palustris CBS 459.81]|uniref:Uncharacterized protein n=1 Tax=Lepidopterella palustris CBS 459.81 TaxID=1314670 RepID=A0A8E2EAC1_9PEZI|nr:hypothetical protein K432DRAFT_404791 [Lepidopterella palustris CBS 459.81]